MELTRADAMMFVYNIGVVLSGAFLVLIGGLSDRITVLAAGAVLALFWTVYFRVQMQWRLIELYGVGDEEEDHAG